MGNDTLIDDRVSTSQVSKAVDALHALESKKQAEREETELLPGKEPNIWLVLSVKQVAPKSKIKPYKIPIVHPLVDPRTAPICLITKDPQREYKDLLETHSIKFISRVVGIAKLKGKFRSYEARRLLLKENGLFLADDRVIPLLPKLLGAKWFEAKKQPIPVCLTRKDLKAELERAISSTYMHQNNGTCTSIKVGNLSHTPQQILSNITKAIPAVASHIPGGWDNIQSLLLKTNTSVSLPIWACDPDGRWSGLIKGKDEEGTEVEEGDKKGKKKREQINSKKRPVDDEEKSEQSEEEEEEEEEQPKKKKIKSGKSSEAQTHIPSNPIKAASKSKKEPQPQAPVAQPTSAAALTDQKSNKSAKSATVAPPTTSEQQQSKQKKTKITNKVQLPATATDTTTHTPPKLNKEAKPSLSQSTTSPEKSKTLTKDELKQKRQGAALLEKKKKKVIDGKVGANGKSVKAKMLGKKALHA